MILNNKNGNITYFILDKTEILIQKNIFTFN